MTISDYEKPLQVLLRQRRQKGFEHNSCWSLTLHFQTLNIPPFHPQRASVCCVQLGVLPFPACPCSNPASSLQTLRKKYIHSPSHMSSAPPHASPQTSQVPSDGSSALTFSRTMSQTSAHKNSSTNLVIQPSPLKLRANSSNLHMQVLMLAPHILMARVSSASLLTWSPASTMCEGFSGKVACMMSLVIRASGKGECLMPVILRDTRPRVNVFSVKKTAVTS